MTNILILGDNIEGLFDEISAIHPKLKVKQQAIDAISNYQSIEVHKELTNLHFIVLVLDARPKQKEVLEAKYQLVYEMLYKIGKKDLPIIPVVTEKNYDASFLNSSQLNVLSKPITYQFGKENKPLSQQILANINLHLNKLAINRKDNDDDYLSHKGESIAAGIRMLIGSGIGAVAGFGVSAFFAVSAKLSILALFGLTSGGFVTGLVLGGVLAGSISYLLETGNGKNQQRRQITSRKNDKWHQISNLINNSLSYNKMHEKIGPPKVVNQSVIGDEPANTFENKIPIATEVPLAQVEYTQNVSIR